MFGFTFAYFSGEFQPKSDEMNVQAQMLRLVTQLITLNAVFVLLIRANKPNLTRAVYVFLSSYERALVCSH